MAKKNKQADDALLMAIAQEIQSYLSGNPSGIAAATAIEAMSDIKRDRADQNDIHRIARNSVLDQNGMVPQKIQSVFQEHPNLIKDLSNFAEEDITPYIVDLSNPRVLQGLGALIYDYLQSKRKYAQGGQFETNENWIDVQIGKNTYHLLVAETEDQKENGLKNAESMDSDEGMLFDYSDEPQDSISFWMQDTSIPLDIIFINQDGVVISVKHGEPYSEELVTEDSDFVSCVVELNANSGVKAGDKTDLFEELNNESDEDDNEFDFDEFANLKLNRLVVYGPDGEPQGFLQGSERIFSRKSTRVIIKKAKKAYMSKDDKDYKALGRYIFNEMKAQNERPEEYVEQ